MNKKVFVLSLSFMLIGATLTSFAQESSVEDNSTNYQLLNITSLPKRQISPSFYSTPWYGVISLRTNTAKYTQANTPTKGTTTYFDINSVKLAEKSFSDFGIPFAGYVLKLLVTGSLNNDHPTGEVPFIYIKGGYDIVKVKDVKIGLGVSAISVFMRLPNNLLGYSALKYGAVSPLIYAKFHVKSILIAPIFEYHVVKWTDNRDISRSGYSLGAYVVLPINDNLGININPYFEGGKFTVKGTQYQNMTSSNLGLKIGLVTKL